MPTVAVLLAIFVGGSFRAPSFRLSADLVPLLALSCSPLGFNLKVSLSSPRRGEVINARPPPPLVAAALRCLLGCLGLGLSCWALLISLLLLLLVEVAVAGKISAPPFFAVVQVARAVAVRLALVLAGTREGSVRTGTPIQRKLGLWESRLRTCAAGVHSSI